jgi:hypothetical protein
VSAGGSTPVAPVFGSLSPPFWGFRASAAAGGKPGEGQAAAGTGGGLARLGGPASAGSRSPPGALGGGNVSRFFAKRPVTFWLLLAKMP